MIAHKESRFGKMMDKVIPCFVAGKSYTNRKGPYKVKSINCTLMTVIYEGDSIDTVLNINTQRQIIFSIEDDAAVYVKAKYLKGINMNK